MCDHLEICAVTVMAKENCSGKYVYS